MYQPTEDISHGALAYNTCDIITTGVSNTIHLLSSENLILKGFSFSIYSSGIPSGYSYNIADIVPDILSLQLNNFIQDGTYYFSVGFYSMWSSTYYAKINALDDLKSSASFTKSGNSYSLNSSNYSMWLPWSPKLCYFFVSSLIRAN